MKESHGQVGEHLGGETLVLLAGGFVFDDIRLVHQRTDDEPLASLQYLLSQEAVGGLPAGGWQPFGSDFLPTRGKLVDGGNIQVAVQSQAQCAGYGRGRHQQRMRRLFTALPQGGSLGHPKSVLLVGHRQYQFWHRHTRLNQGMGAYNQVQRS